MDTSQKHFMFNMVHATSLTVLFMLCVAMMGAIAIKCAFAPSIFNLIELAMITFFLGPMAIFLAIEVIEVCKADICGYIQTNLLLNWLEMVHMSLTYAFLTISVALMCLASNLDNFIGNLILLIFTGFFFIVSLIFSLVLTERCWKKYSIGSKAKRWLYNFGFRI